MVKLYSYTKFNQDGTVEELGDFPEKKFSGEGGLYELLNCSTVELIPDAYYPKDWKRCTVWGDEEARFNTSNHRNPHMELLFDDLGRPWDVVGNVIRQTLVKKAK